MSASPTQPITEWLAKIGLERYAGAFADNDIDVSVLRHLTDADLEKIGVSLGHRRKMARLNPNRLRGDCKPIFADFRFGPFARSPGLSCPGS